MSSITSPTLLVDKSKCKANIRRIKEKADRHGLSLKPHMKTHLSADIGEWLKKAGVTAITVSSVKMAAYFADNGWNDITVAFPVNILEKKAINRIASRVKLTLLISDSKTVPMLDKLLNRQVSVYIEIDTGADRTGFSSDKPDLIQEAAREIQESSNLKLYGLYSHPGHSYRCRSLEEIKSVHSHVKEQMLGLKDQLEFGIKICIGDTPCCSVADDFMGIDEISPGNFVFYDLMQTRIGSCNVNDVAVSLACPVVAAYPERQEIVIHGGAVHLSKEFLQSNSINHFGLPVKLKSDGWGEPLEGCYVKVLSQEHGILKCTETVMQDINVGEIIGVLPVHSCLTADLMMGYQTLDGEKLNHIRASHFYSNA